VRTLKTWRLSILSLLIAAVATPAPSRAEVVLETRNLRLEIADDGIVKGLKARPAGTEYAWVAEPAPVAAVYRGGQMAIASQEDFAENEPPVYRGGQVFPATHASMADDKLVLRFGGAGVTATYRVTTTPDYLAFRLVSLEGEPVDRIDLVRLRVKRLPYLGPWIDAAYDDAFGVCLCGGNLETNAGMTQHERFVEMMAIATREAAMEGATAVLFGFETPKDGFLSAMEIVERDFKMPAGAAGRRSPSQKCSYLWCSPTVEDVDRYIALAKRAGFRTILYSYTAFTKGAGHFVWNDKFPGGAADLKRVADKIRAAGLNVGLHIHYSKAVKTDAYVTPVPDDRFHKARSFTLAAAVTADETTIPVREDPAGCTRADGRRILQVGRELIAYGDYTTEPPYRFTGCERGHLKTARAAHAAGDTAALLDVDDWHIFVRFDQNTDIQDEAARRIAEIYRQTGPYDVVYFDGAEDVHDPFWHHVAGAQHRVYKLLEPPPPVCEAAMSSHYSWHIMSRGNAFDLPRAEHIKGFCREVSCPTAGLRSREFTRINFGWVFNFFPDMGPDVLEYVLSRGAAWDCPFSLRLTLEQVAANPRAEDCLDTIKTWEDARIENRLSEEQRAMLRTLDPQEYRLVKTWHAVFLPRFVDAWQKGELRDQEHHLFRNERGEHELVAIREVPGVGGGRVKAFSFRRAAEPNDTYVVLWAVDKEGNLAVGVGPERLTLMRPFDKRLPVEAAAGGARVPVGDRRYLRFSGMGEDQTRQVLGSAKWAQR
jgi:hypothetical protein